MSTQPQETQIRVSSRSLLPNQFGLGFCFVFLNLITASNTSLIKAVNFQHTKLSNPRLQLAATRHAAPGPARKGHQHPAPMWGPCPRRAEGPPWSPRPHSPSPATAADPDAMHTHIAGQQVVQLNAAAWASRYYKIQFIHTGADEVPPLPQLGTVAAPTPLRPSAKRPGISVPFISPFLRILLESQGTAAPRGTL